MAEPEQKADKPPYVPPDLPAFLATAPLYGPALTLRLVPLSPLDQFKNLPEKMPALRHLIYPGFKVDAFCPACGQPSIFATAAHDEKYPASLPNHFLRGGAEYFNVRMFCSRVADHHLVVTVRVSSFPYPDGVPKESRSVSVRKIGMFPSLVDLQQKLPPRLAKALGKKGSVEFNRGAGLVSHGIGIGALVYLRRIFEDLIDEVAKEAISSKELTKADYYKSRMDDKIGLLKARLPKFMVENRKWYSIVSKGIHELTEEECLEYFPVVRQGIEIILDQKAEVMERAELEKVAAAAIRKIAEKHETPPSV